MNESSREQQLQSILHSYLLAVDAGENPDREEWLRRHPEFAAELREFFADQSRLDRLARDIRRSDPGDMTLASADTGNETLPHVRYFGDYELQAEIARGGMGIVYRARQVSLNRPVALKMILAGQLASETDVRRFQAEAEAAANLDHPNILPVYEVGRHEDSHYFSMKLVAGGTLASRIAEFRADPRAAVTLLMQVARAVHFAHQRGVLHRDLKPGNVLLDSPAPNSGLGSLTPFVADFGLAKRVEGNSDMTVSGAIVGTPAYMPPEQARAEKALTVAADVYSLGAILYELLTGRPPFRGASPVETLVQVMEQDPEPLRRINPAVARDLETVCLKCLAKEPAGRYASAGDLADELERWLAGDGVLANPPSGLERLARWGQKNPAQAALLVALISGFGAALFYAAVQDGTPKGAAAIIVLGLVTTPFIAFLILRGNSQLTGLEKRLRRERLADELVLPRETVPASAMPAAEAISHAEIFGTLRRGALNGALLASGVALSLFALPLSVNAQIREAGVVAGLTLMPAIAAAIVLFGASAGAVVAVAVRCWFRPFGKVAWLFAWLAAGGAMFCGMTDFQKLWALFEAKWWQELVILLSTSAPPFLDWWNRHNRKLHLQAEAAGKISAEKALILKRIFTNTNHVIETLPVLVILLGAATGHFAGLVCGRSLSTPDFAGFGAEAGGLFGRLIGALVGGLLTLVLLKRYRIDAVGPWPGQGDRPYPKVLAACYVLTTVVLITVWILGRTQG